MKMCKKCKTHVANKAKICKKCGADVSKVKIITNNNASKSKTTKTHTKQKNTPIKETKSKTKDKVVVTQNKSKKDNNKKQPQVKTKVTPKAQKKVTVATKQNEKKKPSKETKNKQQVNKSQKTNSKTPNTPKKDNNKKQTPIKETKPKTQEKVNISTKQNEKKSSNKEAKSEQQVSQSKKTISKTSSTPKKDNKKTYDVLTSVFIYLGTEIYQSLKTTVIIVLDIIKAIGKHIFEILGKKVPNQIKNTHAKIQKAQENKPKKNKEEKYATYKLEDYKEQIPKKKETRKHRYLRYAIILIFIVSVSTGLYLVGKDIYKDLTGTTNRVVVTEKATTEKVFSMEDIITYNNVDYKVVKIETSKGNSYKSPKAGHQFLIVTVYIKNNTGGKVPYSYENWTMSNSKGEEKKRIFSSINVDTALYSGELVIGGIKTGSMVFEQPVNDPKLKMNFYELKKDDDGNEVIDEAKRIFSISVKVPNKKAKTTKETSKSEDVKVVKTNTKNKS